MHASHPAPSSTSGGRLVLTRRLVLSDRPFVELGDPGRERFNERIQLGVGQGAINVAVGLGLVCADVFRAQEHLEGAVSTDESGQPSHGAAAGDHPHAHLPLRDDCLLAAGKTHVARQGDLAAVAGRTPADKGDGGDWQAGQAREKVRPGGKPVGPSGMPVRSSSLAVKSE